MKALSIIALLSAALAGCTYYTPTPVAVAPAYVAPPSTVVLGSGTPPSVVVQPAR